MSLLCISCNVMENFMFQIVVIIVIWVISLLVIYMLFLICLDPLLNKRIHKASANIGYHEHNNEEVNLSSVSLLTRMRVCDKCNVMITKYSDHAYSFFLLQRMIHLSHLERLIQWGKEAMFWIALDTSKTSGSDRFGNRGGIFTIVILCLTKLHILFPKYVRYSDTQNTSSCDDDLFDPFKANHLRIVCINKI